MYTFRKQSQPQATTLFFLALLSVCASPRVSMAAKTQDGKEPKQEISINMPQVKAQLLQSDFYKKFRDNFQPDPSSSPEEQAACVKAAFLKYKYRVLGEQLRKECLGALLRPAIFLTLFIAWYLYCRFVVDLRGPLGKIIQAVALKPMDMFGQQISSEVYLKNALRFFHDPHTQVTQRSAWLFVNGAFTMGLVHLFMLTSGFVWAFLGILLHIMFRLDAYVFPIIHILRDVSRHYSDMVPYLRFLLARDTVFVDPMEGAEIYYMQNQHRLPSALQKVIEDALFAARKYDANKAWIAEFVHNAVDLPTADELKAPSVSDPEAILVPAFETYNADIQDALIDLYLGDLRGIKPCTYYLEGPHGVGKTNALRVLVEKSGARLAIVSFAGVSREDLVGRAPRGSDPGYIGLIAEAIMHASEGGKYRVVVFIDELDKAFQGKFSKEIEALCLDMVARNSQGLESPYLGGYNIPLLNVVFAGNGPLPESLKGECLVVKFREYTWEEKERIIRANLPKMCEQLSIDPSSLTEVDYVAIHKIIAQMKRESEADPDNDQYTGLREVERRVFRYLETVQIDDPTMHTYSKQPTSQP